MKLLAIFGVDRRIRRLRIAAAEAALAAEDRASLLRFAWQDEKHRLQLVMLLSVCAIGLTTVMATVLSMAIVVHFWETPNRIAAAWWVAALWIVLWLAAVLGIVSSLRRSSNAIEPARDVFAQDWAAMWHRVGAGAGTRASPLAAAAEVGSAPEAPEPAETRANVLARIARQRERIATLRMPAPPDLPTGKPPPESASTAALRLAREHPIATGAITTTAILVLGPQRLLRWAVVALPVLWRLR